MNFLGINFLRVFFFILKYYRVSQIVSCKLVWILTLYSLPKEYKVDEGFILKSNFHLKGRTNPLSPSLRGSSIVMNPWEGRVMQYGQHLEVEIFSTKRLRFLEKGCWGEHEKEIKREERDSDLEEGNHYEDPCSMTLVNLTALAPIQNDKLSHKTWLSPFF